MKLRLSAIFTKQKRKALIKNIEVRKNRPKQNTPFPCYIYETKAKGGCGKVIGEFVCDEVDTYSYDYCDGVDIDDDSLLYTMLERDEINYYAKGKTSYGWHISDLKIYDKPKELSKFCSPCKTSCENCKDPFYYDCWLTNGKVKIINRPPQSWCYVEWEAEKAPEERRKEDEGNERWNLF